jgi:hypothetical protein
MLNILGTGGGLKLAPSNGQHGLRGQPAKLHNRIAIRFNGEAEPLAARAYTPSATTM